MGDRFKGFLYGWLGKQRVTPKYEVRSVGTKIKPMFESELSVKGYDQCTYGVGQTKKEAQSQAAIQFLYYLVDKGDLLESEMPEPLPDVSGVDEASSEYSAVSDRTYDTKNSDEESAKFGYWTIKNAKAGVHTFMQQRRIEQDYIYSCVECEESKFFVAELSLPLNGRESFNGRGEGGSKQDASRACALSIIRELYINGMVDAYKAPQIQESSEIIQMCKVSLSSHLEKELETVVSALELDVCRKPRHEEIVSLITKNHGRNQDDSELLPEKDVLVKWLPPMPKMQPWSQNGLKNNIPSAHILEANQIMSINDFKDNITYAVESNPVVIIRGVPGSGKSTQVPQYILDSYIEKKKGMQCHIMVVEPHDISAVLAAETVANEREERVGETCGYITSYEVARPRTFQAITYCTAGMLLQSLTEGLKGISHIIVDEVHDRNMYIDVLLAILKDMTAVYPHLRIVLMAATVDIKPFSVYFNNCPVIEVACRLYAVHEYFLEDCIEFLNFMPKNVASKKKDKNKFVIMDEAADNMNKVIGPEYTDTSRIAMALLSENEVPYELIEALLVYIHKLNIAGSVLLLLPGLHAVFTFMALTKTNLEFGAPAYIFYPLHHLMSSSDLRKASEPVSKGTTKVILTTSVSESCVSISDVVFVINYCKAKMELSHAGRKIYATSWITKANIEQRKDRAGLFRPGFCFHLCSRARYQALRPNSIQIQIVPIHDVLLKLRFLGVSNTYDFFNKMLDPPALESIRNAEDLLMQLGALSINRQLTPVGKILAQLPIDPRLGKMVLLGCLFELGDAMCTVAAQICTFTDPFVSVDGKKKYGLKQFSDHIALLKVFEDFEIVVCSKVEEERFCERNELEHLSVCSIWLVKEKLKKKLQLAGISDEALFPRKMRYESADSNLDLVIALMCVGFYPNICQHKEKQLIVTSEKNVAQISGFSVNCRYTSARMPFPFLVYGEQVATHALNCKHTSMVTPVHLLLFGCQTVDYVNGVIVLDGVWQLQMHFDTAAELVALRKGLEDILDSYVSETAKIESLRSDIEALMLFETSLFEGNVPMGNKMKMLINLVKKLSVRHLAPASNHSGNQCAVMCCVVSNNPQTVEHWHHCPVPLRWDRTNHHQRESSYPSC